MTSRIYPGLRVAYNKRFLTATGQLTSDKAQWRGRVREIKSRQASNGQSIAIIDWDFPKQPASEIVCRNLVAESRKHCERLS